MLRLAEKSESWILICLILTCLFIIVSFVVVGFLQLLSIISSLCLFLLTVFFMIFFRDPERTIGNGVVASADGIIYQIKEEQDDDVGPCVFLSTFMNVYNVHVNRIPIEGTISKIIHIPGGHIPAFKKESEQNERMITLLDTEIGPVKLIQIAGACARRIVNFHTAGQHLKKGERIGMIRLGSRVDLFLPKETINSITVTKGDHVRAGETQITTIQ